MAYTPVTWTSSTKITVEQLENIDEEIQRLGTLLTVKIAVQETQPSSPSTNEIHLW